MHRSPRFVLEEWIDQFRFSPRYCLFSWVVDYTCLSFSFLVFDVIFAIFFLSFFFFINLSSHFPYTIYFSLSLIFSMLSYLMFSNYFPVSCKNRREKPKTASFFLTNTMKKNRHCPLAFCHRARLHFYISN